MSDDDRDSAAAGWEAIRRLPAHPLPKPTPRLIRQWLSEGIIDRETAEYLWRNNVQETDCPS